MAGVAATDARRLKLTGNTQADALRMERAVASLTKRGKFDMATDLTKAYTSSNLYAGSIANGATSAATAAARGAGDGVNAKTAKHNQQRLASILANGDVKKGAANLYAYGWQTNTALSDGSGRAFSYDEMAGGPVALVGDDGTTAVGTAKSVEQVVHSKIDAPTVAGQDKDADWNMFSVDQMAGALTSGNISQDKLNVMVGSMATTPGRTAAVTKNITAQQMQNISPDTFAKLASASIGRSITPANFSTLTGVEKANIKTRFFKTAYDAARSNPDVAKHWNPNIKGIFGV
jgi:hypothetical protein